MNCILITTRRQLGVQVGCTDQSKQYAAAVNKNSRVCDNIPWNSTRIYRPETFAVLSPLAMEMESDTNSIRRRMPN